METEMDSFWADRARVSAELRPVEFSSLDYDEGLGLYRYRDSEFTGACSQRYPDGELENVVQMVDGAASGVTVGWFPDGQIQYYRELSRGVRHGKWLEWAADGSLVSERRYERGRLAPSQQG
jgi:antitoxin component YwqK of YwqJK toxin-antitoxin module